MAGDLQATIEICVELSTFHNVDLFQRGYYQIRCSLKPPEKAISCVDVEYTRINGDYQPDDCLYPALVTPSGLTAVSKTFQILYKNEEIVLSDSFIFRLNMLVDSNKLTDQIDQADVQLLVELCFSDAEVGPDSPDCLVSVSSQVLKLHLSCIKGLHHHVPVLFDYFHFAVIDTTLHAVLVKLSLPDPSIFKMPKPSWFSKSSTNTRMSTPLFYSKLFGYKPINNILTSRTASEEKQIRFAYDTHRSLCSTLFSVKVNLLAYFDCLSEFLPESQHIQLGLFDFGERLESALESIQSLRSANEVFAQICSDLDSISNEVSLVWSQFLESYTLNRQILPYLRNEHHRQRVGHFSEAFFLQDFSWDDLQVQQEQSFQLHQSLGQGIKNSRYYQTIPAVAVECPGLDGDSSSTPIIFEDKYTVATSQQEADHVDSDLEKVDLVLEDDTVVNNEDIFIIETDSKDVLASKDDPNMPLLLGGVLCDRDGPVRETMILDDDIDDGNSYLIKTLKEIQDLENQYLSDGNASDNQGLDKPNLSEENEGKCSISDDMSNLNLFDIPNQSDVGCMVESTAEKDSANELEVSKDATSTTDNDTNKNSSIPGNDINNDCEISKEVKSTINAANTESSGVVLNAENSGVVINETSLSPDQPSQEASDDSEVPADQSNEENVVENTVIITQNSVEDITKKDDTDKTKCENKSQDTQSDKDNKNKASEALVKDMASIEETCLDEEEPKQSNPAITSEETQKTERNSSDDILENALKDEPAKGFEDGECLDQTTQDDLSAQVTSENSCNDEKLHQVSTSAEGDENDSSTHEMENPNSYNKSEKDMEKQSILEECNASDEKKPLPDIDNEEAMLPKYSDFEPEEKQITSSSNLVTNCDTPKLDNNDATPILDEKHPSKSDLSQCGSLNTVATGQEEMPSTKSSDSASDITNQTPRTLLLEHPPNPMDNKDGCRKAPQLQHHQQQEKQKEQNTRSQNTSKKTKKKSHQKGMAITGCLPVGCTGNSSPSFSRGNYSYGGSIKSRFELAKRYMKRQLKFSCQIYSDIGVHAPRDSYFSKQRPDSIETHLIVCVHGLDGNSGDLRLFKCYLEMALPSSRFDFLMSEINQGDTFVSFEELTDRLVQEILHYIDAYSLFPSKISFVGHSLGNIIIRSALSHPGLEPLLDKMHTLLSLSGPHLGMLYPTSPLVSTGLWLMQKWKKSEALMQLSLNDHEDLRQTYLFRLSQSKGLEYFKNVLLVSSVQDHYVPYHSARIEMCKAASKDTTEYGSIYRQMVSNLMSPLYGKKDMTLIRYSCYHALNSSANSFIGRAAHIAMLDSELFIEKLLLVSALDYFR